MIAAGTVQVERHGDSAAVVGAGDRTQQTRIIGSLRWHCRSNSLYLVMLASVDLQPPDYLSLYQGDLAAANRGPWPRRSQHLDVRFGMHLPRPAVLRCMRLLLFNDDAAELAMRRCSL